MLVIASLGGILGAVDALRKGILLPVLYNCGDIIKHGRRSGGAGHNRSLASAGALAIPYGVAIARRLLGLVVRTGEKAMTRRTG